jgi:phosphatidate cytidylyltransferase
MNNELLKRVITSIVITFLSFYCIIKGTHLFDLFILSILSLSLFEWNSLSNKIIYFIIGSLFLIFAFFFAYQLRNINLSFFLFTIIISISSDIGGYVCGKIFKGPKLTKISPNKTFSGCIGSFFFSIVIGLLYLKYIDYSLIEIMNINLVKFLFLIITFSAINQIGDLTISYFKRINKVKNTGNILPGHGGVLDRIDGMIFVLPVAYYIFL